MRNVRGSTGQGCKGACAGGSAQFGSYGRHGYTRPLSSSTGCADAVLATSKTNSAATASINSDHMVGLPPYCSGVSAAFPNVALSKGIGLRLHVVRARWRADACGPTCGLASRMGRLGPPFLLLDGRNCRVLARVSREYVSRIFARRQSGGYGYKHTGFVFDPASARFATRARA